MALQLRQKNGSTILFKPDEFAGFDVLGFWKEKESMFLALSRMAGDMLSAQATSVAFEFAFSTSGRVLSIGRTRLTPTSLKMLIENEAITLFDEEITLDEALSEARSDAVAAWRLSGWLGCSRRASMRDWFPRPQKRKRKRRCQQRRWEPRSLYRRGRGRGFQSQRGGKLQIQCYNCRKYGHYANECTSSRKVEEKANLVEVEDKDELTLLMARHDAQEERINPWHIDFAASNHMTGEEDLFVEM
uniref:Retrovirus-related Pol polyprotein from transposon TNT 1-94 n=1 Tax=Tanacetum cinerariifolium TaxID=118510 RepID=A0A6L2LX17_TANCI|nr:retrovirus-related Pol polyprotein from transposon TNT 1-94 [Tanacetum cinerariifolium]